MACTAGLRGEFADLRGEFAGLRGEMSELGDRLDTRMRVLYEDVIARIALVHEGLTPAKRTPRKKQR